MVGQHLQIVSQSVEQEEDSTGHMIAVLLHHVCHQKSHGKCKVWKSEKLSLIGKGAKKRNSGLLPQKKVGGTTDHTHLTRVCFFTSISKDRFDENLVITTSHKIKYMGKLAQVLHIIVKKDTNKRDKIFINLL